MSVSALSTPKKSALLSINGLRFAWQGNAEDTIKIDHFSVNTGERLFIKGASGSGKTTLLSLLGGVISPQSGSIELLNTDITELTRSARDSFRADHIGFIFQMFNLIPYLSLQDNVILPCRFSKSRYTTAMERSGSLIAEANRLLVALGIDTSQMSNRSVSQLSVGQQQRVAASRALIGNPDLIIADEPTSALDNDAQGQFLELLFREVESANSTLLFVSHDNTLATHFDRVVTLNEINEVGMSTEMM